MAIASITAWLTEKNPNYHHGRMLYEQYGDDRLVLTIIKSGSGSYHFNKLKEALELVNTKTNLVPKPIVFVEPVQEDFAPAAGALVKPNLDHAPAEVRKIRDDKNKLYAEARHLFVTIKSLDSDELRLNAAIKLLENMDDVAESWHALDTFNKTGEILKIEHDKIIAEVKDLSTVDLLKELKNLPPNISKARGNCAKANDPIKKAKYQVKIQHLITRLTEVQRRVNEFV